MRTRRLFVSTVTHEFKSCRVRLAEDLRFPDVIVQNQEEYVAKLAAGESLLIKLDDYIRDCDAVIHLIGQQTSEKGEPAKAACVDDLLRRYADLSDRTGLAAAELSALSYTQWEAWLACYHKKSTRPALKLYLAVPAADFTPDHPPHAATAAAQAQSQIWHAQRLRALGYYPEIHFESADRLAVEVLRALKDILPARQPAQSIADSRLVTRHTTDALLGRDAELELLDHAWARDSTHIQCVIAWGGVGKTALLAHWVQTRFRDRGWKNADGQAEPRYYFDWTFYDQGVRASDATQAGAASVGSFFSEALRHFGDAEPELPERKAERLAARVQAHRSLIVLDGLEPLQYPLNHPQAGQLTDPDLARFLRLLAQKNPGLCLISSREALSELGGHLRASAPHHDLDDLPTPAAIALLRQLQVTGSDADLACAAAEYQHHALSLILLGRFLVSARGGDIRRRDTVSFEKLDSKRDAQTRSAWRVLQSYEHWLASPAGKPTDLQALRLVGLFDRPATPDCLQALRRAPAIPGITDRLQALDDDDWNAVLRRLHAAHLIQLRFPPHRPGSQAPHPEPRTLPVDAHPLIREYFARQLRGLGRNHWWHFWRPAQGSAFQAAHARLFEHLCRTTEHQPDTLDGLQPLYQAVVHGCLAGRHQQACLEVYIDRILRSAGDNGLYSTRTLGAFGADLGAVAAFFEVPWSRISPTLSQSGQAWLLNNAAFSLRALGRPTEALELLRKGLDWPIKAENWTNAAIGAINLSDLEMTLGSLDLAMADARCAIGYADRTNPPDLIRQMGARTTAANVLHQLGGMQVPGHRPQGDGTEALTEARQLFEQAEQLVLQLYSFGGFYYCDLILAPEERGAWRSLLTAQATDSTAASCRGAPAAARRRRPRARRSSSRAAASAMPASLKLRTSPESQAQQSPVDAPHASPATRAQLRGEAMEALAEAERRANYSLPISRRHRDLLSIALDRLTLARVALYRAMLDPAARATYTAQPADTALDALRKANSLDHLPQALLTAAIAHHLTDDPATARDLLDEAQQIAERGPMPLYLADVHLHRARLVGVLGADERRKHWPGVDPRDELARARELIDKHHYGRRFAELADAEAAALHWQ